MIQVSQEFYNMLINQQASYVTTAAQQETVRDTGEANRVLNQDFADAIQLVLDDLEVAE
jgi:hypothetical protein